MEFISIPGAFRQAMEELGVKGKALAAASGCTEAQISKFRKGGEITLSTFFKLLEGGEACASGFKVLFVTFWLGIDVAAIANISDVDAALNILQNGSLTDDQIAKGLMILSVQLRKSESQVPEITSTVPEKIPALAA